MAFDIGWYNGWSPDERRATTPTQSAAIQDGLISKPTTCSICGHHDERRYRSDVWLHDEDYNQPLAAYAICRTCHGILHRRFDAPTLWLALVAEHAVQGSWFAMLSMDPECRFRPFAETYPDGLPAPRR